MAARLAVSLNTSTMPRVQVLWKDADTVSDDSDYIMKEVNMEKREFIHGG